MALGLDCGSRLNGLRALDQPLARQSWWRGPQPLAGQAKSLVDSAASGELVNSI